MMTAMMMRGWARHLAAALIAGFIIAPAAHQARAEPACTPIVRVSGEPALARQVISLLRERRVSVAGESRCGTMTAVLNASGARTRITIVDADGRTVERMAEDVEAAATAIESWARGDLSAPLLAAREAPPRQAPDRESPQPIEQATVFEIRTIEVGAGAGVSFSSDGALWTGAQAQACVAVGFVCAGALVRYAWDTQTQGDSVLRSGTLRSALDTLLVADLPLRIGRFSLTPGVGVGQTSLRAEREGGEHEKVTATGLNLRARAGAGVRVSGAWSLQAELSLGYSPFARKRLVEEQIGPDVPGDEEDDEKLSGVPRLQTWLGLGLVYGGL